MNYMEKYKKEYYTISYINQTSVIALFLKLSEKYFKYLKTAAESSFNEKQNCTDLKIHYKVKHTFKLMS